MSTVKWEPFIFSYAPEEEDGHVERTIQGNGRLKGEVLGSMVIRDFGIYCRYIPFSGRYTMPDTKPGPISGIGKIFMNGRSQAVRIPKEFRLDAKPGDSVRFRRTSEGILIERVLTDPDALFATIDRLGGGEFLEEGRLPPPMPDLATWDDSE